MSGDVRQGRLERVAAAFGNAPWWLISAGLHLVILLAAALIVIEQAIAWESKGPIVIVPRPHTPLLNQFEPEPPVIQSGNNNWIDEVDLTPVEGEAFVFDRDARVSDKNRSDDDEDFDRIKGNSKDFMGGPSARPQPAAHRGLTEVIGRGPGGTVDGRHGGPFGGRDRTRAPWKKGTPQDADDAVMAALRWLARHQNLDGSWSVDTYVNQCAGARCAGAGEADFDAGVTGLSVLAFLGAGFTHLSKDAESPAFGQAVKKGVQWLMARQDAEGCLGVRGPKHMYSHAIAALALAEAYGMTVSPLLKDPAQKAIDYLVAAQNPGQGWRYSSKCGDNDTSVTGWAVMALKSAELSELSFPRSCYDGALAWLNAATDGGGYYAVGYNGPGTGKVFVNGKNEQFSGNPAMSAVSVMSRIFITRKRGDPALGSVNLILGALPEWNPGKIDYYYWYYASLALFQYDGPGGPVWKRWNGPMKSAIIPNQKTARHGCADGSWDSDCERWGFEGGRVYATAINALTLEVYYRYASVFGGAASK